MCAEERRSLSVVVVLGVDAGEREALSEADTSTRSLLEVNETARDVAYTSWPEVVHGIGHVRIHSLIIDLPESSALTQKTHTQHRLYTISCSCKLAKLHWYPSAFHIGLPWLNSWQVCTTGVYLCTFLLYTMSQKDIPTFSLDTGTLSSKFAINNIQSHNSCQILISEENKTA